MSKQQIKNLIQTALEKIKATGELVADLPEVQVDPTKDPAHGDFATNVALLLAKAAQLKPRDLADLIAKNLSPSSIIREIQIAGPGFINFYLVAEARSTVLRDILAAGKNFKGMVNLPFTMISITEQ